MRRITANTVAYAAAGLLLCSAAGAQTGHVWTRTNPGGGGAFSTVKAGPSGVAIAGSDLSGAYCSRDRGLTWDVIGASRGLLNTHVSGVGFSPSDPNVIFLGTTNGIYRSTDGGESFVHPLSGGYVNDIVVAASNPAVAYAAFHSAWNTTVADIHRSLDSGKTWAPRSARYDSLRILKVAVDPQDENTVYFLSGKGRGACGPACLYRSRNGAAGFTRIGPALGTILDFKVHPTEPAIVYATTMNADCGAQYYYTDRDGSLYRSHDYGDTWREMSTRTGIILLHPDSLEVVRLIDPRNTEDWNSRSGTWTSRDSGATWAQTGDNSTWSNGFQQSGYGTSFDGICKAIGEDLSSPANFYWVTTQWVFGSFDNGTMFEHLNSTEVSPGWWRSRGFDNVNMMDMKVSRADPDIVYLGYFDIGLWRSLDHGESWQSCNEAAYTGSWNGKGGNVATVVADPARANVVWASMSEYQEGEDPTYLVRSNDTGSAGSWTLSNTGLPSAALMGLSLDPGSPQDNRTLFVSAQGDVYRSTDDGATWSRVLTNGSLWFTAVDRFDSRLVYAGGGAGLWRSINGGDSWQEAGTAPMRGTADFWGWGNGTGVFDIEPDPHHADWVYVTIYGSGKGLYRSRNRGDSWEKLLSDDYMRKVALSPLDTSIIYATSSCAFTSGGYQAGSRGVLYSDDAGQSFVQVNEDMAWPFAMTVAVDATGWVFVGSPGTGFQKSPVPGSTGTVVSGTKADSVAFARDAPRGGTVTVGLWDLNGRRVAAVARRGSRSGRCKVSRAGVYVVGPAPNGRHGAMVVYPLR